MFLFNTWKECETFELEQDYMQREINLQEYIAKKRNVEEWPDNSEE